MPRIETTNFLGVRDIAALGTTELRGELYRLLDGFKDDTANGYGPSTDVHVRWQEEIAWVMREAQCRYTAERRQSLYDYEFKGIYQNAIYGPRSAK